MNTGGSAGFDLADGRTVKALLVVLHSEGLIERPEYNLGGSAWVTVTVAGQRRARRL